METIFWDRKRVLMAECMQQETTIMSEVYSETLKQLRRAIQNKTCGMLTSSVLFPHDNACPYTDGCTPALLKHFNWELSHRPPYSPDLAPGNYHLFTYRKNCWDYSTSTIIGVDLSCQNVAELTGSRLLWHRHTKTYSLIWQMPQFWQWLLWEVAEACRLFLYVRNNFFLAAYFVYSSPKILSA
jgi:hypothetical protein